MRGFLEAKHEVNLLLHWAWSEFATALSMKWICYCTEHEVRSSSGWMMDDGHLAGWEGSWRQSMKWFRYCTEHEVRSFISTFAHLCDSMGSRAWRHMVFKCICKEELMLRAYGLAEKWFINHLYKSSQANFLSLVTAFNLTPYKASTDLSLSTV